MNNEPFVTKKNYNMYSSSAQQPQLYTGGNNNPPLYGNNAGASGVVMGTVDAPCSMTNEQLEDHLKQSNYGQNKAHYLCYFHEGMPPRCVTCGQSIGAHQRAKPNTPPRQAFMFSAARHTTNDEDEMIETEDEPTTATCSLCKARQEAGGEEGALDSHLTRHWYEKTVSTNEYNGEQNACGCWSTDPVAPPTCEECGIAARLSHPLMSEAEKADVDRFWARHPNLTFSRCDACTYTSCYTKGGSKHRPGHPVRFYCHRTVCSNCIQKGYHKREQSRFHHNERAWRTTLFGCCSSPRLLMNTIMCYYCCDHPSSMWEGQIDTFDPTHLHDHVHKISGANCMHGWLCPIFCWWYPLMNSPLDLFCCTISRIRDHEREVRARFGVAEHSTAEMVFCRHCVYNRLLREAEARGYPQPTMCTGMKDMPFIVASYPPHPHAAPVMAPASNLLL